VPLFNSPPPHTAPSRVQCKVHTPGAGPAMTASCATKSGLICNHQNVAMQKCLFFYSSSRTARVLIAPDTG